MWTQIYFILSLYPYVKCKRKVVKYEFLKFRYAFPHRLSGYKFNLCTLYYAYINKELTLKLVVHPDILTNIVASFQTLYACKQYIFIWFIKPHSPLCVSVSRIIISLCICTPPTNAIASLLYSVRR